MLEAPTHNVLTKLCVQGTASEGFPFSAGKEVSQLKITQYIHLIYRAPVPLGFGFEGVCVKSHAKRLWEGASNLSVACGRNSHYRFSPIHNKLYFPKQLKFKSFNHKIYQFLKCDSKKEKKILCKFVWKQLHTTILLLDLVYF